MNINKFLRILRESLELSLEQDAINAQLDFYDKYINDEIKKGRTEKEIIDELGDPRLIAKTIKTVTSTDNIPDNFNNENNNNYGSYGSYDSYGKSSNSSNFNHSYKNNNKTYGNYVNNNGTIGCIIFGLVMFIIIYFILSFVGRFAYGVGELAFSGPIGFLFVLGIFYLLFGRRK